MIRGKCLNHPTITDDLSGDFFLKGKLIFLFSPDREPPCHVRNVNLECNVVEDDGNFLIFIAEKAIKVENGIGE